jgi:hypothetical protein
VANIHDVPTASVTGGQDSWNYLYVALGFALAIAGTIIQMVDFLHFPCNVLLYVVTGAGLFWLFLFSRWFRNKLIELKKQLREAASMRRRQRPS